MTRDQRYRLGQYVRNSVWILPVLSMPAAIVAARSLHWVEREAGWWNISVDSAWSKQSFG